MTTGLRSLSCFEMDADVDLRIYAGMGHTIIEDELQKVRSMIAQ